MKTKFLKGKSLFVTIILLLYLAFTIITFDGVFWELWPLNRQIQVLVCYVLISTTFQIVVVDEKIQALNEKLKILSAITHQLEQNEVDDGK